MHGRVHAVLPGVIDVQDGAQAQGSGRGTSAEGRGSGGSSADGSAGEMAPDQAAARPQPQRGVRKENGHAAAHGEHAANGVRTTLWHAHAGCRQMRACMPCHWCTRGCQRD